MTKPDRPGSGFVPIGNVVAGVELPDGRALTPAAPQARHHFTTLHQVNQLIEASEADADLGFMARLLALCSLPRTNPGDQKEYVRRNGPYALVMSAGGLNKLPFGTLPRLLLAWVCSEAVRLQSRELVLGRSLYEFMRKLGMDDRSGSVRGDRTRLKNQMRRLFACTVTLVHEDAQREVRVSSLVADRAEYWWDAKQPDAPVLWDSKVELGEKFFQEIIAHPIPLDLTTLKALKRSPLGLDLYFWLVYRTFTLKAPLRLSWRQLYRQFGSNPTKASDARTVHDFRKDCLRELKKINRAWPDLLYGDGQGRARAVAVAATYPASTTPAHRVGQPAVGAARLARERLSASWCPSLCPPAHKGGSTGRSAPQSGFSTKPVISEVFHR